MRLFPGPSRLGAKRTPALALMFPYSCLTRPPLPYFKSKDTFTCTGISSVVKLIHFTSPATVAVAVAVVVVVFVAALGYNESTETSACAGSGATSIGGNGRSRLIQS